MSYTSYAVDCFWGGVDYAKRALGYKDEQPYGYVGGASDYIRIQLHWEMMNEVAHKAFKNFVKLEKSFTKDERVEAFVKEGMESASKEKFDDKGKALVPKSELYKLIVKFWGLEQISGGHPYIRHPYSSHTWPATQGEVVSEMIRRAGKGPK
jgi:hypothetical protein